MNENPLPEENDHEYVEIRSERSTLHSVIRGAVALGALAVVFSVCCWAADLAGRPTGIPYVPIGIAGLIVYNLARLPSYMKLLLPEKEEPEDKFHRK